MIQMSIPTQRPNINELIHNRSDPRSGNPTAGICSTTNRRSHLITRLAISIAMDIPNQNKHYQNCSIVSCVFKQFVCDSAAAAWMPSLQPLLELSAAVLIVSTTLLIQRRLPNMLGTANRRRSTGRQPETTTACGLASKTTGCVPPFVQTESRLLNKKSDVLAGTSDSPLLGHLLDRRSVLPGPTALPRSAPLRPDAPVVCPGLGFENSVLIEFRLLVLPKNH